MPFRTRAADPAVADRFAALLTPPRAGGWVPGPGPSAGIAGPSDVEGPSGPWTGPSEEEGDEPWTPAASWSRDGDPVARGLTAEPEPTRVESSRPEASQPEAAEATVPGPDETSVLAQLRAGRLDPGRRGVLALVAVGLGAALVAGWFLLRSRPSEQPLAITTTSGVPVAADPGAQVVVDVAGRVRRPGIVRLAAGSRVDDALRSAGGLLPGAAPGLLNLAAKVTDGQQVLVGVAPAVGSAAGSTAAGGQVDLNAATTADLDGLPGVGPVLAQRIVDWRTEHQRFASVDQLREVNGIGESKYQALKAKVRV